MLRLFNQLRHKSQAPGELTDCGASMILPTWSHRLEKGFSSKEVKLKKFCLSVKNSCPPAENINRTSIQCLIPQAIQPEDNYLY